MSEKVRLFDSVLLLVLVTAPLLLVRDAIPRELLRTVVLSQTSPRGAASAGDTRQARFVAPRSPPAFRQASFPDSLHAISLERAIEVARTSARGAAGNPTIESGVLVTTAKDALPFSRCVWHVVIGRTQVFVDAERGVVVDVFGPSTGAPEISR